MILRPLLFAAVVAIAPFAALAQSAPACDPSVNTCPDSSGGVNVDP